MNIERGARLLSSRAFLALLPSAALERGPGKEEGGRGRLTKLGSGMQPAV